MILKELIKHLQVPNRFIQKVGIYPAILLSELLNKERYLTQEEKLAEWEYFYHEYKYIYKNTALLKVKYTTARKKLESLWIIETKYGEKKRVLFRINEKKICELFFPRSLHEMDQDDFLELILTDGYIFYPAVLAHKIWIQETIFIKSLVSKRKSFLAQGKLNNGYFFNTVANVKSDTSLSRDQQLSCIQSLTSVNLLDVQYTQDNTRYFCINIDLLSSFENLNLEEVLRPYEEKQKIKKEKEKPVFSNPFQSKIIKHDDPKTIFFDEAKIWKHDESDILISDKPETTNLPEKNTDKSTSRNENLLWVETTNIDINKNKNNNKEKNKKQNKGLLLSFIKNVSLRNEIESKYSSDRIEEVIYQIQIQKPNNPSGFLRWALENNIIFNNKQNQKEIYRQHDSQILEEYPLEESKKILDEKKKYLEWKQSNFEKYKKILDSYVSELSVSIENTIKLQIQAELQTKKYIIETYISSWE